jgi:SAM-dependent methyltransferase
VTEWFEHWFGEAYLDLYPHRDDADAGRIVELLHGRGWVRAGDQVLDLACGAGRHIAALASQGARVAGFDLSMTLLRTAQRRPGARLVRGDMRALAFGPARFDLVANLFTSFGYFERDDDHRAVVREVARVLRPGGRFVLDFLNAPAVRRGLVRRDSRQVNGRRVVQERSLTEDGRFVEKRICLEGEGRHFLERVRLFERADLEAMLREAGLTVECVYGDYDGGEHTPASSRLLLIARRA